MFENLVMEQRDRATWLILNRPPANIMDLKTMREMIEALRQIRREDQAKVVVIRGAGEKAFCTGVDVRDHTPERVEEMAEVFHELLFEALPEVNRPVIAAVNGPALGGGCELAMCCDMVVAAEGAQFGQPEILLAVYPGPAIVVLPRIIGPKRAFELIITGRPIDARTAERMGLVNCVVPNERFDEEVTAFVSQLLDKSLPALKLTRMAFYRALDLEARKAAQAVSDIYLGLLMATEDAKEGISSFLERRKPRWKDR